ncbi:unnamed protein product [Adineta steineri]|nr:unnamed protein product [Adineta steineri]CAF1042191.1 unnamed protein product [Adineta steineri]CAF1058030.1 unnamed protein product [Adineta steineri]CAF3892685.1 unnamed protein product [Adineta steineri]CAF4019622.1 unnamed protein product [Adineta steineri]
MLLAISICHVLLFAVYHDQCPASPYLSTTLGITGIIGIILSTMALIIHRYDAYDGPNKWNLFLTFFLLIYLIISRIIISIMAFRLASRIPPEIHCAVILYWASTLLILISYSMIIINFCLLIKMILLHKRHQYYRKSIDIRIAMAQS